MKFSILIPTLNEEKYLPRLLTSLTRQTFTDFEVIVCDGRSTDKTVSVGRKFSKSLDLKVIISPKRGISYQRNLAAKNSRTENLIFLDADTIVEKSFLAKVNHALINRDFDIAATWLRPESDRLIDKIIFGFFNCLYLETFKYFAPGGTGAFLYVKKSAFNHVRGFDAGIAFGEDFDFIKRLCQKKNSHYHLFHDLGITFSVRRLDKEGRLFYLYKMIRSSLYYLFRGSIRDEKIYIKNEFGKF